MPWHLTQMVFKLSDLAFIDKIRVHLAMTRHFTNIIKGKYAYDKSPNNREKKLHQLERLPYIFLDYFNF